MLSVCGVLRVGRFNVVVWVVLVGRPYFSNRRLQFLLGWTSSLRRI